MSARRHDCSRTTTYDASGARCGVCGATWRLVRNREGRLIEYRLVRQGRAAA